MLPDSIKNGVEVINHILKITRITQEQYDSIVDARDGQVYKIVKIGNQWRFNKEEVEEWAMSQRPRRKKT
jgi:hypothetical protein